MSMHEIESLIETTIRVIDKSSESSSQKRNLIWNAYNLQNNFDCSFTHFRLMDILLNNQFAQTFELKEFPLYKDYSDYFDGLNEKNTESISKKPTERWSRDNQSIAYWDKKSNKIYADYGTEFYSLFPDEVPQEIMPLDFGLQIIVESNRQKDRANIYNWTAFMLFYLLGMFPSDKSLEDLKRDYFSSIKSILNQYDYTDYEPLHDGLDLENDEVSEYLSKTQKELLSFLGRMKE